MDTFESDAFKDGYRTWGMGGLLEENPWDDQHEPLEYAAWIDGFKAGRDLGVDIGEDDGCYSAEELL